MPPPSVIFYCACALFAGGLFKGVAGIGLPLVGVPLLTAALSLKEAVAVLVMPLVFSNLVQSFEGGLFRPVLRRFWPIHLTLFVTIVISTQALVAVPERYLFGVIGILLVVVPCIAHLFPGIRLREREERWLGPLTGIVSGLVGGVSSYYGPLLLLYVMWLRLPKAVFVVAVSQMYTVGSLGLALGLLTFDVASPGQFGVSALACAPALAGLLLGQRVRLRLSERRFSRLILAVYLVTGASFLLRFA